MISVSWPSADPLEASSPPPLVTFLNQDLNPFTAPFVIPTLHTYLTPIILLDSGPVMLDSRHSLLCSSY